MHPDRLGLYGAIQQPAPDTLHQALKTVACNSTNKDEFLMFADALGIIIDD